MSFTHTYVGKALIAVDVFACTLIWGDTSITISSMTGLALMLPAPPRWAVVLGWALNHIEANHTTMAIADDIERLSAALAILQRKVSP